MKSILKTIIIVLILGAGIFWFRAPLSNWAVQFQDKFAQKYLPCQAPIAYSLGTFDKRFGLSEASFLSAMSEAEAIWEKPIGKDLFSYSTSSAESLQVNLIYDTRQESTIQLQKMGIVVKNNEASYDAIKAKYDAITREYDNQKAIFETRVSAFNVRKQNYEAEVRSANKRGGADEATYDRLTAEKDYLQTESSAILSLQDDLNAKVEDINALTLALNQLATILNIDVDKYNTVSDNFSGEFNEGLYKSDASGQEIDIYQFENRAKLVRVLAHELGHALGLDHVEDPKAIMYRLNNGVNGELAPIDLVELKSLCGIE